jgi:hypothetical protein
MGPQALTSAAGLTRRSARAPAHASGKACVLAQSADGKRRGRAEVSYPAIASKVKQSRLCRRCNSQVWIASLSLGCGEST